MKYLSYPKYIETTIKAQSEVPFPELTLCLRTDNGVERFPILEEVVKKVYFRMFKDTKEHGFFIRFFDSKSFKSVENFSEKHKCYSLDIPPVAKEIGIYYYYVELFWEADIFLYTPGHWGTSNVPEIPLKTKLGQKYYYQVMMYNSVLTGSGSSRIKFSLF